MSEDEIKTIEARANAATPGPWEWGLAEDGTAYIHPPGSYGPPWHWRGAIAAIPPGSGAEPLAVMLASARSDVPALVAEVKRLRKRLEQWGRYDNWLRERIAEALDSSPDTVPQRDP